MVKKLATAIVFAALSSVLLAQNTISIPAYTAYAVPAEPAPQFSATAGITNWVTQNQQIQFYFTLHTAGKLNIALLLNNSTPGNKLTVNIARKVFSVTVPTGKNFKSVPVGAIDVTSPGTYSLIITSAVKNGKTIAGIKSLQLSGSATKNIQFNNKERRNAASVHLLYPLPDTTKAIFFYNEITVPETMDPLYSYYMACGFARGYLGMQINSAAERRIIFSVWDAGDEAVDRNKVVEANKVQLTGKGENVIADGFGNEGTGGHSHWLYNWKAGETYKFLVTAAIDSAAQTTSYAGYFFIPETQQWKLIACFKAPKDGKTLKGLYSFSENFDGANGQVLRKAFFSNQWLRTQSGQWREITESKFSYDATAKAGDRTDYGGGADGSQFYLWHGGFAKSNAKFGDVFTRKPTEKTPVINFYKNADSAKQAAVDKIAILKYIDTDSSNWRENNSVYYKITKPGTGNYVNPADTVVVHYKGQLLNGFIFDRTKETPATFPLQRLIKGWQMAVPFCRIGGSIRLLIPSAMGYTIRNNAAIPPNSVLVFDIDVAAVK